MKTWVITGGAASGKSSFCQHLLTLEPAAVLFSSDEAVHEIFSNKVIAQQVARIFDSSVLDGTGAVDRAILRGKAFADDKARLKLESLIHPLVYENLERGRLAASEKGVQLFIAEIPLFYECGTKLQADLVILVAAGDAFQRRRLMEQRGLDSDATQRILSAQLPLERKLELAQSVVWNEGGPELLQAQAQLILKQYF